MQRMVRSPIPPNKVNINTQNTNPQQPSESPAFLLAKRIKNEQGAQKASEFLLAIEAFIAPAERVHISSRLSLPSIQKKAPQAPIQDSMKNNQASFNPLPLFNMLSGMNNSSKGASNAPDPAMLARLMSMMNKK